MFGRQWTNKAKIAIFNYPIFNRPMTLNNDVDVQRTPANICINLTLPETTFPGLHFCRWQYMGWLALQIFEQFSPKAGDDSPLVAEPETDFNAKWPFMVIQGNLFRYHWRAVAQYNKCGLRCEGSEDIANERSENRHFRPPHSHLTPPLQRKTYLAIESLGYIFAADSMGLSSCKF